jgi:hypothetical protein
MAQHTLALLPRQTFAQQQKKNMKAPSDCLIRKLFRRGFLQMLGLGGFMYIESLFSSTLLMAAAAADVLCGKVVFLKLPDQPLHAALGDFCLLRREKHHPFELSQTAGKFI